jgi:PIN domain nuclease of toxin-antitoxin system
MLVARGRLRLDRPFPVWVGHAQQQFPLHEARLTHEVARRSHMVTLPHRDPADHFLAATTLVYDMTLLTVDTRLTQAAWLPTRSA